MLDDFIHLEKHSENSYTALWRISIRIMKFIEIYFGKTFNPTLIVIRLYEKLNESGFVVYQETTAGSIESSIVFEDLELNSTYYAEAGLILNDESFFPILRSNTVTLSQQSQSIKKDQYTELSPNLSKSPKWSEFVSTYTYYGDDSSRKNYRDAFELTMAVHRKTVHGDVDAVREGEKNILLMSWEYPPHIVGGLSKHVYGLAVSLCKLGYGVHVITSNTHDTQTYEINKGVHIHRVKPLNEHEGEFLFWIGGLNLSMIQKALELDKLHPFCCIHAHDWLVGACGIVLKETLQLPLYATIHATEHGRNSGIYTEMQKIIHHKEQQLIQSANSVIVCSEFMKNEIQTLFSFDHENKIKVIPNGTEHLREVTDHHKILSGFPIFDEKHLILSLGRIVEEKGFDTLIKAAKKLKHQFSNIYFVIAGVGPLLKQYKQMVSDLHLENDIFFVGFVTDVQRTALLSKCKMAVFPSRYEPFGIVALESMQAGKPTIVSNIGGLKEIVQHKRTGLLITPGNPESIVEQVSYLLKSEIACERLGKRAREEVESLYSWDHIAKDTIVVYEEKLKS